MATRRASASTSSPTVDVPERQYRRMGRAGGARSACCRHRRCTIRPAKCSTYLRPGLERMARFWRCLSQPWIALRASASIPETRFSPGNTRRRRRADRRRRRAAASHRRSRRSTASPLKKSKDNLFVIRGAGSGGNTAVFVTAKGVTARRHQESRLGPAAARQGQDAHRQAGHDRHQHAHCISTTSAATSRCRPPSRSSRTRTPRRTCRLFATVIAGAATTQANVFKANPGKGLPKRTFTDKLTIGSGADQINLYYFGPAHTGGDAFVEFAALRVMHAGDAFARKAVPLIDADNGGSGVRVRVDDQEGGRRREERRHHHQRTHGCPVDARRDARVRGFRQRFRRSRPGREEGRQDRRRGDQDVDGAGEVQGYTAPDAASATAWAQVIMDETK